MVKVTGAASSARSLWTSLVCLGFLLSACQIQTQAPILVSSSPIHTEDGDKTDTKSLSENAVTVTSTKPVTSSVTPEQEQNSDNKPSLASEERGIEQSSVQTARLNPEMIQKDNEPVRQNTPRPRLSPKTQIGQAVPTLENMLGAPDFIRKAGQILTYQYRLARCVVDYYFVSDDAEGATLNITSWDMRARYIGEDLDTENCEEQLAERQNAL